MDLEHILSEKEFKNYLWSSFKELKLIFKNDFSDFNFDNLQLCFIEKKSDQFDECFQYAIYENMVMVPTYQNYIDSEFKIHKDFGFVKPTLIHEIAHHLSSQIYFSPNFYEKQENEFAFLEKFADLDSIQNFNKISSINNSLSEGFSEFMSLFYYTGIYTLKEKNYVNSEIDIYNRDTEKKIRKNFISKSCDNIYHYSCGLRFYYKIAKHLGMVGVLDALSDVNLISMNELLDPNLYLKKKLKLKRFNYY